MRTLSYASLEKAKARFQWHDAWTLADGTPDDVNATVECLDRHAGSDTAVRLLSGEGSVRTHDFDELARGSARFANLLADRGVDAGDRVAVMLDPSYEFLVAFFGAMRRGAVAVPCSELFGPEALAYRLEDSGADLLVTTDAVAADLGDGDDPGDLGDSDADYLPKADLREVTEDYPADHEPDTAGDDEAWLQYTSGTTGRPTPVPYHHESVVLFAPVMDFVLDFDPSDACFTTSSTGWGTGIWIGLFAPLFFGVPTGHLAGPFDADVVLDGIERMPVTTLIGVVPTAYRKLVSAAERRGSVPTVAKANYVGEPIDAALSRSVTETFGAFPRATYGVTEVRSIISVDYAFPDYEFRHGSMGTPLVGVDVRIVDEETPSGRVRDADPEPLPAGEVGVVAVRRDDDWIVTKDAAYRDEDGYLWSVGRVDDTIISAGYTIGPQEVEDALRSHPDVLEAGVVGVPDDERGQAVKAFVEPVAGTDPDRDLAADLQSFVRERLSKHEYPREVEFLETVPTTPDGKVKRAVLRDREGG